MIKKTLGGDRLGSGAKMEVEMHNFDRSTHNYSFITRTTQAPGTVVPTLCEIGLPGDTWDIEIDTDTKTPPTIGPLFGSYKQQHDIIVAPIRLYNGLMHNNTLNIGRKMSNVKLPQIELTATAVTTGTEDQPVDTDNSQIHPSCILAYLGIRGIGSWDGVGVAPKRQFNITALLAYWDTIKNYYANKQEEVAAVIHTPSEALVSTVDSVQIDGTTVPQDAGLGGGIPIGLDGIIQINWIPPAATPIPEQIMFLTTSHGILNFAQLTTEIRFDASGSLVGEYNFAKYGNEFILFWRYRTPQDLNQGKPAITLFALSQIDEMRNELMKNLGIAPIVINTLGIGGILPYQYLYEQPNGFPNIMSSQEGLALKTYQSDVFQNWLNTEWIDGIDGVNAITAIDTSGGSFTMNQLLMSNKLYDLLNRVAVSGGTIDDWQEVVYGHRAFGKTEIPMYMGGLSKEIVFQEVISNSESPEQPLGTLAGKGILAKKHKGGKVILKIDEPCYILGLQSITPRIDYSQGNRWDVNLKTVDDLHKPLLDQIGFEDSINEYRAWWDTNWIGGQWVQTSAGKVPAWINYMTNYNRNFGNFAIATNQMWMTLNRKYEPETSVIPSIQIKDLTTYIDPTIYNYVFAQTELDAQNFWVQTKYEITLRRKISAKIMPNL